MQYDRFWANTPIKDLIIYARDAIGESQGESVEAGSGLRKQVQNFAAHGMAGAF